MQAQLVVVHKRYQYVCARLSFTCSCLFILWYVYTVWNQLRGTLGCAASRQQRREQYGGARGCSQHAVGWATLFSRGTTGDAREGDD
jgi:hypothetical protein